ncbi:hypothetical protein WJX77_008030 [Trebouxia sp. C0004]
MPPSIITHPAFKTLMTAQIQAFMLACPLSAAVGRAVRWDQLKAHIQDVARSYCSTFHAGRTRQLRALRVQAGLARGAYLADPTSQPALDQLRHTAADLQQHRQQQAATDALRAGVLLHEYGDQSTYYFHHLHRQRQQATVINGLQQQPGSPLADLCTETGRQQAGSIILSFFSADSPTGMFKQLPTDMAAQQTLLSSLDRQLPPAAHQDCEGPDEGVTLAELHSALKASARGEKPGTDGLPYKFYTQFWDLLGPELLAVLQDSFQNQLTPSLPASMTQGVITLLYKGTGARSSLDSYRPITLLNSDYKLLAQALATRLGPALQHVIDPTQTAFVPGRWIGDNVLCHLEEVEYLQQTGQPGCIVFLDFSKAYDRLSRSWVQKCMSSMGFGHNACKWVSIMLHNTSATATFNGWRSASFPERSGVQQGSPLSPLLYVIAAQPLASHLRRQSQLGVIRPITMPDGQAAPISHQHADDSSLHVLQPRDAQVAIDTSIRLFCAASSSQLNASKSQAFLVQSQPLASATINALPNIRFITGQQTVKHLGVRLGYDMSAACHQTFTSIHQAVKAKVRHWSARGLSFLGRVHVGKQVLAASLWYHATFQQPPKQLLQQISRQLSQYVASAQHHGQSDAALALAQGNSQDSAALPAPAPSAALFPRVHTSSLLPAQGGVGLVEVPTQIQALKAKVVSRLLEPERLAWKVFQLHHLSDAPRTRALAYGATILFSTISIGCLQLPARLTGYVLAFRALRPHRLLKINAMPAEDVLNEPIFYNRQVSVPPGSSAAGSATDSTASKPLTPHDQPLLLATGITKVAHLQAALQQQQPAAFTACLQSVLMTMPPPWRASATAAPTAPAWRQGLSASGSQLIQNTQTGQHHLLKSHDQLQESHAQAVSATTPVHVISWDPSRPWRGPAQQPTRSAAALGQLWGPKHLSVGVWGWGRQPAHQLIVRQASQRLRLIQAQQHGILTPGALVCRPRFLPLPGSDQSSAQVLQELESRWTASMQASPASRARPSSDLLDPQPAWMAPSCGHRPHWAQRQQRQQSQQQQPARQPKRLPSDRAANDDTVDVLGVPVSHPQLSEWRKLWELASAAYFDRQHRILWWRILHGCVMCGAFSAYIGRATPQQACCPFACCCTPAQPQTISHMFLECPVAATVVSWLCRLWQAMTGYMPVASVATILAASTPDGQCSTDALFQTWHRLRLAVLHSIWTAARITASSTHGLAPPQASPSQSRSHLASGLALKTITSMIRHDWVKCNDDVWQISGLCSSWLRGNDPSMTLGAFQHLWCHNHALASVHTIQTGPEGRLELRVHLSASSPVPLF